jgi:hypothetical protein
MLLEDDRKSSQERVNESVGLKLQISHVVVQNTIYETHE